MNSRMIFAKERLEQYNKLLDYINYVQQQVSTGSKRIADSGWLRSRRLRRSQWQRLYKALYTAKRNVEKFLNKSGKNKGLTLKPLNKSLDNWVDTEKYLEVLDNARRADEEDNKVTTTRTSPNPQKARCVLCRGLTSKRLEDIRGGLLYFEQPAMVMPFTYEFSLSRAVDKPLKTGEVEQVSG